MSKNIHVHVHEFKIYAILMQQAKAHNLTICIVIVKLSSRGSTGYLKIML